LEALGAAAVQSIPMVSLPQSLLDGGPVGLWGLPHPPRCPLCDQDDETIQHLLASCVFARQVWVAVLGAIGLLSLTPLHSDEVFQDWWSRVTRQVAKEKRKGFHSLVILVAWSIWKHRNRCVFEGHRPSVPLVVQEVASLARLWSQAGARGLNSLLP